MVSFRVSPEENEQINTAVALSGLNREVVVQGNPRVFKALKHQLAEVLDELHRIEAGAGVSEELLNDIQLITVTLSGMRGDSE